MSRQQRSPRRRGQSRRLTSASAAILLLTSCASFQRPERIIEPDVIGLVTDADFPIEGPAVVQVGDRTLEFDRDDAVELDAGGIQTDALLLYGEDFGRTWYASLSTLNGPDCYLVRFDGAFDEPEAVVFGFSSWREVGLRLPKRDDFNPPQGGVLEETGQYMVGNESAGGLPISA